MVSVTEAQKEQFKKICNKQFDGKVEYVIISLLIKKPNIVDLLLENSVSFNYLVDNDVIIETTPVGWQTNGCYRNTESVVINPSIKAINFGLIIDSIKDVDGIMRFLKETLGYIAYTNSMRIVIGDTLQINFTSNPNSIIFKSIDPIAIVDVTFKYFRALFGR